MKNWACFNYFVNSLRVELLGQKLCVFLELLMLLNGHLEMLSQLFAPTSSLSKCLPTEGTLNNYSVILRFVEWVISYAFYFCVLVDFSHFYKKAYTWLYTHQQYGENHIKLENKKNFDSIRNSYSHADYFHQDYF